MTPDYHIPKSWLAAWTAAAVFFLLAPLACVVLVSLTPKDYISFPTDGISWKWYAAILSHPGFLQSARNSIGLAFAASATSLLIGVAVSVAMVRYRFKFRGIVQLMTMSPLFIPMVMSGLAILIFTKQLGWDSQIGRIFAGHVVLTLPYVVRTVSASLTGFDPNQELAARNLGASPLKAFLLVTVPQLGPGLFAGTIFAFIVSFDNVGLSIFLTGSQFNTLPVELYSYASYNNDPTSAAVSVLMIVFSIAAIAALEYFFGLQRLMRG